MVLAFGLYQQNCIKTYCNIWEASQTKEFLVLEGPWLVCDSWTVIYLFKGGVHHSISCDVQCWNLQPIFQWSLSGFKYVKLNLQQSFVPPSRSWVKNVFICPFSVSH